MTESLVPCCHKKHVLMCSSTPTISVTHTLWEVDYFKTNLYKNTKNFMRDVRTVKGSSFHQPPLQYIIPYLFTCHLFAQSEGSVENTTTPNDEEVYLVRYLFKEEVQFDE